MRLINCLRRTNIMEFGWTICRHDNERHKGLIRFGNARMQLGGGGATGHDDHDRYASCEGSPESKKTGAALIEANLKVQLYAFTRRQNERRRP
jgi:hypothetical protein